MTQDFFNEDELKQLQNITKTYYLVKDLLLYSEQLDEQELFLPAINEIKDSFDHLMRVFAIKFGLNQGDQDYIKTNLGKTYSHTYRALYDLLDYTAILQRKIIYKKVKDVSHETLISIYPRYYQNVIPDIGKMSTKISLIKEHKDIGNPDNKDVDEYLELIEKMKLYITEIDMIMPGLLKYENERKAKEELIVDDTAQTRLKDRYFTAIITIIGALISGTIGYFLGIMQSK